MSVRSYKTESDRERERARETPSPASVSPPPISGSPGLVQTPNSAPLSSQIPRLHFHQKVAVWLIPHNVGDLELSGGSPASRSASGGFGGGEVWVSVGGGFGAVPGDFLENDAFWPCFSCNFIRQLQSIGFWWHWCNFLKTWGQLSLVFDWRGNFWWLLGIDVCWKLLVRRDTWIEALTLKIFTSAAIEFGKQFANRVAFLSLEML